ncbi:MAG: hypothetical protein ACXAC8_13735 [Candidatus Hodarchaeales archaeon]|jgi:hypothetical protein
MFSMSFVSTGTTASQTPVMASISYEIIKNWINKESYELPDFPLAAIFDFSNMYSTLQFFATDKIMMRMGELTSLIEEMRSSTEPDWSKCSFPSKFVHKDTNNPLFFMVPIFPRGMTSYLTKSETIDLTKIIFDISQIIKDEGCKYIFFDLPIIDIMQKAATNTFIPALLNSNVVIGVVDSNKPSYTDLVNEVKMIRSFLADYNVIANPKVFLNGIIFNQVSETIRSSQWLEKIAEELSLNILGKIRQDPQFFKISSQYQIPTVDSLFDKMRCAKDFQLGADLVLQEQNKTDEIRHITKNQLQHLAQNIFSFN